jgi:hypothetical protein
VSAYPSWSKNVKTKIERIKFLDELMNELRIGLIEVQEIIGSLLRALIRKQ